MSAKLCDSVFSSASPSSVLLHLRVARALEVRHVREMMGTDGSHGKYSERVSFHAKDLMNMTQNAMFLPPASQKVPPAELITWCQVGVHLLRPWPKNVLT